MERTPIPETRQDMGNNIFNSFMSVCGQVCGDQEYEKKDAEKKDPWDDGGTALLEDEIIVPERKISDKRRFRESCRVLEEDIADLGYAVASPFAPVIQQEIRIFIKDVLEKINLMYVSDLEHINVMRTKIVHLIKLLMHEEIFSLDPEELENTRKIRRKLIFRPPDRSKVGDSHTWRVASRNTLENDLSEIAAIRNRRSMYSMDEEDVLQSLTSEGLQCYVGLHNGKEVESYAIELQLINERHQKNHHHAGAGNEERES